MRLEEPTHFDWKIKGALPRVSTVNKTVTVCSPDSLN